jgi:hypothetical protein
MEDAVSNDQLANFCETPTARYDGGDRGTPGLVNEACGG